MSAASSCFGGRPMFSLTTPCSPFPCELPFLSRKNVSTSTVAASAASPTIPAFRCHLNLAAGLEESSAAPCALVSAIHLSSLAKSPALCHLSSTAFARHFSTTCSRTGGVIGLILLIGVGSLSRIAEATLNWLLHSNALRP